MSQTLIDRPEADAPPADSERNTKGQFKFGNKGGPGNPYAGKTSLFRAAVLECVTAEDLHDIVRSLVQMAKDGHWQAAKLILTYVAGKPGSLPDPDAFYFEEPPPANPPSTNGESTSMPPSPNGVLSEPAPSANGVLSEPAPSANGVLSEAPSPNGILREPTPLPNGFLQPVLNRKQRRAQRKAERLAKARRNTPTPVTAPVSAAS